MSTSFGSGVSAVVIRTPTANARTSSSHLTQQTLLEIGKKAGVLDTAHLEREGLGKSFAAFDVTAITPAEMGLVSKNLFALGLIDRTTANLMISAGTSLDAKGNQTKPNEKMNALDFFASRIQSLRTASIGDNEYGFHVVNDYITTVHALQNLNDFAQAKRAQLGAQSSAAEQVNRAKAQQGGISVRI